MYEVYPDPEVQRVGVAMAFLTEVARVGDQRLEVGTTAGFEVGQTIVVAPRTQLQEFHVLTGISSLIIGSDGLRSNHDVGTRIEQAVVHGENANVRADGNGAQDSAGGSVGVPSSGAQASVGPDVGEVAPPAASRTPNDSSEEIVR